jgi:prepilin-type processing-associated H-X9-DG protein/prepilin-type N-terminal cleavage/methylation domain-containing protein
MKCTGLTLVELLVVLSIIALLAALLFPAFHSARERTRATTCGTNVRQLLVALHTYESDNESLPYGLDVNRKGTPPGGMAGDMMTDPPGWWWFHSASVISHRSARERRILQCPSKRQKDSRLKQDILVGNYGANLSLCRTTDRSAPYGNDQFQGVPLSTGALRQPGVTLLVVDSGYSVICWWHAAEEPPVQLGTSTIRDTAYVPGLEINKDRTLWPGQADDAINGRHPNKTVNVGFADGHVDNHVKAGELLVRKTGETEWDCRPLWSPE